MAQEKSLCYNNSEVTIMTARVERVLQEIRSFTAEELRELLKGLADNMEMQGWLKIAESAFSDWDNQEDDVYDLL